MAILFFVVCFVGYDYWSNKNRGPRFTYNDGVALTEHIEGDLNLENIDSIYNGNTTDFRDYISNKID